MSKFAIQRKIEIDAAHRVPHHGSKCFNIHGHRYVIEVACTGEVIDTGVQTGMVMDFGFLKEVMVERIHNPCDHATILWRLDPMLLDRCINPDDPGWKIIQIDPVPTAENLAKFWYDQMEVGIARWFETNLKEDTPPTIQRVLVHETPNCVAWYPAV